MQLFRSRLLAATALALCASAQAQIKWDLPAGYPATNFHSVTLTEFAAAVVGAHTQEHLVASDGYEAFIADGRAVGVAHGQCRPAGAGIGSAASASQAWARGQHGLRQR